MTLKHIQLYAVWSAIGVLFVLVIVLCTLFARSPGRSTQALQNTVHASCPAVRAATVGPIDTQNIQDITVVDDVALRSGDLVLVWQQPKAADNGLYRHAGDRFERAAPMSHSRHLATGMHVYVVAGTIMGGTTLRLFVQDEYPVLGESDIQFRAQAHIPFRDTTHNRRLLVTDNSHVEGLKWIDESSVLGQQAVTLFHADGHTVGFATKTGLHVCIYRLWAASENVGEHDTWFANTLPPGMRPHSTPQSVQLKYSDQDQATYTVTPAGQGVVTDFVVSPYARETHIMYSLA